MSSYAAPQIENRPRLALVAAARRAPIEALGGTLATVVVDSLAKLDAIEPEWQALYQTSPTAAPPLHFGWVREWWSIFGSAARTLHIVTVRRGSELIGAAPLYLDTSPSGQRAAYAVSLSGEEEHSFYPEYVDILVAPGTEQVCSAAVARDLVRPELRLRAIHFGLVDAGGVIAASLRREMQGRFPLAEAAEHRAPVADLSGGFDAYLTRLPAKTRQQMRRLLRGFYDSKEASFEIARTPAEQREFLAELIDLHQARWEGAGESGAFRTAERKTFHRGVVQRMGDQAVVTRLRAGGRTLAAIYGFIVGQTFHFYQSGNDIAERGLKRPGIIAHLLTMEALARRGVATYDFLAGEAPYKLQLATAKRPLADMTLETRSAAAIISRAVRRLRSFVRRRRTEAP